MADVTICGHIEGIRYHDNGVLVTISEYRNGFKKSDGTYVDDEILAYVASFKTYFKKYISSHFAVGMLVKVKGILLPYAKNKDGEYRDGFTIVGQTIDVFSYPRANVAKQEKSRNKDSMMHDIGNPNVEDFMKDDF